MTNTRTPRVQRQRVVNRKDKLSFYIAAKVSKHEPLVRQLISYIRRHGHQITFDWTTFKISKPFGKHRKRAHEGAHRMAIGVMAADVVIVIADERGLGLHIETGAALGAGIILQYIHGKASKKIFLVGKHNTRSMFYYHRSVKRIRNIPTLFKQLKELM